MEKNLEEEVIVFVRPEALVQDWNVNLGQTSNVGVEAEGDKEDTQQEQDAEERKEVIEEKRKITKAEALMKHLESLGFSIIKSEGIVLSEQILAGCCAFTEDAKWKNFFSNFRNKVAKCLTLRKENCLEDIKKCMSSKEHVHELYKANHNDNSLGLAEFSQVEESKDNDELKNNSEEGEAELKEATTSENTENKNEKNSKMDELFQNHSLMELYRVHELPVILLPLDEEENNIFRVLKDLSQNIIVKEESSVVCGDKEHVLDIATWLQGSILREVRTSEANFVFLIRAQNLYKKLNLLSFGNQSKLSHYSKNLAQFKFDYDMHFGPVEDDVESAVSPVNLVTPFTNENVELLKILSKVGYEKPGQVNCIKRISEAFKAINKNLEKKQSVSKPDLITSQERFAIFQYGKAQQSILKVAALKFGLDYLYLDEISTSSSVAPLSICNVVNDYSRGILLHIDGDKLVDVLGQVTHLGISMEKVSKFVSPAYNGGCMIHEFFLEQGKFFKQGELSLETCSALLQSQLIIGNLHSHNNISKLRTDSALSLNFGDQSKFFHWIKKIKKTFNESPFSIMNCPSFTSDDKVQLVKNELGPRVCVNILSTSRPLKLEIILCGSKRIEDEVTNKLLSEGVFVLKVKKCTTETINRLKQLTYNSLTETIVAVEPSFNVARWTHQSLPEEFAVAQVIKRYFPTSAEAINETLLTSLADGWIISSWQALNMPRNKSITIIPKVRELENMALLAEEFDAVIDCEKLLPENDIRSEVQLLNYVHKKRSLLQTAGVKGNILLCNLPRMDYLREEAEENFLHLIMKLQRRFKCPCNVITPQIKPNTVATHNLVNNYLYSTQLVFSS
eukprot:snap_masked-scaffold_15-processed-gene-10.21-mRNA-1 protein AED:1.00 eAED:1.00 QI:0/-1/0/0/-1/1/1/0/847